MFQGRRVELLAHRGRTRARRYAFRSFATVVTLAGGDIFRLRRMARADRLIILNLHSVSPRRSWLDPPLSPESFQELLQWMTEHLNVVTLGQLASGRSLSDRPTAVLSFDDGYRDFVEYAMPILARYGIRVNHNIVPGCIDAQRPPWNVHLLRVLEAISPERAATLELPGVHAPALWRHPDATVFGLRMNRYIKNRPKSERDQLLRRLGKQLPELLRPLPGEMMSIDDVRLVAQEHELGLHSFDHDSMEFETDEFFRRDLDTCLRWTREHLGLSPVIYAFPNGSYRESQITVAADAGIEHILLVGERSTPRESGVRSRVNMFGSDARELRLRLARAA